MPFKSLLALLLIVTGMTSIAWFLWQEDFSRLLNNSVETIEEVVGEVGNLLPLAREVITPPPLRGPLTGQLANLSADGVFLFTNQQRLANGSPVLKSNSTLDQAATNKMQDMFARQYFEHESPTGEGPGDVVDNVGYSYIRVGENLALGNFPSDEALVQAWMDSPGHRANMLDKGFQEIGIGIGKGMYEGRETWIGVQTFATPASACPAPTNSLKTTINANNATLATLEAELEALKNQIEQKAAAGNANIAEGNKEIQEGNRIYKETGDEEKARPHWERGEQLQAEGSALLKEAEQLQNTFNKKVIASNTLVDQTQAIVNTYNKQVQEFNRCAQALK